MSLRVALCTGSGFLAILVRKTLARARHLEIAGDHRSAAAALQGLQEDVGLVIVDAELLSDPTQGAALRRALSARREATIVLDPRGAGVDPEVVPSDVLTILRGSRAGELDADVVEAQLLAAIASTRRLRTQKSDEGSVPQAESVEPYDGPLDLVVVGVSTGGPTLLMDMLRSLTTPAIPFLVVQHMPATETSGFAVRLTEESGQRVVEIERGQLPAAGTIGIPRGGRDYRLERRGSGGLALRETTVPGNPFHPSIDEILRSAIAADVKVGAAILTGMGQDGAAGALALSRRGLPVVAQRPDTCAVAGMPRAVIDNGAARWVQAPDAIVKTLNRWSARTPARTGDTR